MGQPTWFYVFYIELRAHLDEPELCAFTELQIKDKCAQHPFWRLCSQSSMNQQQITISFYLDFYCQPKNSQALLLDPGTISEGRKYSILLCSYPRFPFLSLQFFTNKFTFYRCNFCSSTRAFSNADPRFVNL